MGAPGKLEKLVNKIVSDNKAREEEEKKKAARQADQEDFKRQLLLAGAFNANESAYDLDKHYGQAWDRATLTQMANDPSLSGQKRAKLVEIMLLRGADNGLPFAGLKGMAGLNADLGEKAAYQMAAVNAVVAGQDKHVLRHLTMSGDQLPSGRLPATEFANIMLQEGGIYGSYDGRQDVERWMGSLQPADRGAMMYHIGAAAEASDIGGHGRVTGFEVGVEPVSFGLQWENAKDTHWKQAGSDIESAMVTGLAHDPSQKQAFYEGYVNAGRHLEDPKDFYTPPRK